MSVPKSTPILVTIGGRTFPPVEFAEIDLIERRATVRLLTTELGAEWLAAQNSPLLLRPTRVTVAYGSQSWLGVLDTVTANVVDGYPTIAVTLEARHLVDLRAKGPA